MSPRLLLEWYNLVYVIPFSFAFLFLLLQVIGLDFGGGSDGADQDIDHDLDHDLDHDIDHDIDHDLDHDLDHDIDHDIDHDVDHDLDHDADGELEQDVETDDGALVRVGPAGAGDAGESLFWEMATLLGVGKVPLSFLFMTLFFTWGAFGLGYNSLFAALLGRPLLFFPSSLAATALSSFTVTGIIARTVGRFFPKYSSYASDEYQLVGKIGEALYSIHPGQMGTVRVVGLHGNLLQFAAYTTSKEKIPGGAEVLLADYDREKKAFRVEPLPEEMKGL